MRRRLALIPIAALVLALTGCGGDNGSSSDSASSKVDGLTVTGDFGKQPTVKVDKLDVTKAESTTVIEGDGPEVTKDTKVNYRFYIVYGSNGKEVSSNWSEPNAQPLDLAQQPAVITDAVVGQKIGSRVALAVPVTKLVGADGAQQLGLKPKDDLVMVMDLVSKAREPLSGPQGTKQQPPADAPRVVESGGKVTGLDFSKAPKTAPKDLKVVTLVKGSGTPIKQGDSLTVNYYGAVWGKDKPFDDSYSRGEPATFGLTPGGLIEGWVKGLQGVTEGSRVLLEIPPAQGYGAQGSGQTIPPNSSLVFVIDVLGVNL